MVEDPNFISQEDLKLAIEDGQMDSVEEPEVPVVLQVSEDLSILETLAEYWRSDCHQRQVVKQSELVEIW